MTDVTVRRCPSCPAIRDHAQKVVAALSERLGTWVELVDGAEDEFTVLVDGVPLLQRQGDSLPSLDEVDAAVENAAGTPVGRDVM